MRLAGLCALALLGCAASPDPREEQVDSAVCARVEGADLGRYVTVEVPTAGGPLDVTFTSWLPKRDVPGEFVGFSLDVPAKFVVKADFNFFYDRGAAWENPFGDAGTLAKSIEYVDLCEAIPDEAPPVLRKTR